MNAFLIELMNNCIDVVGATPPLACNRVDCSDVLFADPCARRFRTSSHSGQPSDLYTFDIDDRLRFKFGHLSWIDDDFPTRRNITGPPMSGWFS